MCYAGAAGTGPNDLVGVVISDKLKKKFSIIRMIVDGCFDSVVGVTLEAIQHYDMPLSKEKLCAWQAAFFPAGYSEGGQIEVGQYRTNEEHIISGMFGREKIHYIAPSPERVEEEMQKFLTWFDADEPVSSIIRSAGAHYLKALFKGKKPVSERILKLDAERFQKGDLPLTNLLNKNCSYIVATGNKKYARYASKQSSHFFISFFLFHNS